MNIVEKVFRIRSGYCDLQLVDCTTNVAGSQKKCSIRFRKRVVVPCAYLSHVIVRGICVDHGLPDKSF